MSTALSDLTGPADDPRPVEPEPLPEGACCDSGCDPCVQDTWRAGWLAWKAATLAGSSLSSRVPSASMTRRPARVR